MSVKSYQDWHAQKIAINELKITRYFREREIWWTAVGHNVGTEINGKGRHFARPVLILRKFNQSFFYGLPLSTKGKTNKYYHPTTALGVQDFVLLSHMRNYDAKRLLDKMGFISIDEYELIRQRLCEFIQ